MNPQWPYSIPPPNVPVTYSAQQLQQNSWSTLNSNAGPSSIVCSQSSNTNASAMSVFTSIPPPSLLNPIRNLASFHFTSLTPQVFPSNILPSNTPPSNFVLPHAPPPKSLVNNVSTSSPPLLPATPPPLPSDPPPPLPHDSPPPVPVDPPPPSSTESPLHLCTKLSCLISTESSCSAPESLFSVHTSLPSSELVKKSQSESVPLSPNSSSFPSDLSSSSKPSEESVQTKSLVESYPSVQSNIPFVPHSLKQTVPPIPVQVTAPPPQISSFLPVHTSPSVQTALHNETAAPPVQTVLPPPVQTVLPPPVQTVLPPPVQTVLPPVVQTVLPPPVPTAPPSALHLPNQAAGPTVVKSAHPPFVPVTTVMSCLNQTLPTFSLPMQASNSKVNLSVSHALTVPPAGGPQPYLTFPVQGNSVCTNIPPIGFVPQNIQGNTTVNKLNKAPLQSCFPSCAANVGSKSISDKWNYSCKNNVHSSKTNLSSDKEEKCHLSHDEKHKERHHSSHKEKHSSSYKEKSSLSHKKERHRLSHKDERHHSIKKDERHLVHKEQHYSSHREKRSPYEDRHSSSHKERHHSVHKEKYESSHKHRRSSSHKDKRHLPNRDEKLKDSHEKSCNVKGDNNCDLKTENCNSKQRRTSHYSDSKNHKSNEKYHRSCSRKRTPSCNISKPNKRRRTYSDGVSPSKRRIERERSCRREISRNRSKLRSEELRSSRNRRNKEQSQSVAKHRYSRVVKRRRSSTPKDLPCLSPKTYKYIISTPAVKYYGPNEEDSNDSKEVVAKDRLKELHDFFKFELVDRSERIRALKPKYEPPKRKTKLRKPKSPKAESNSDSSSSEKTSSDEEDTAMEELERKKKHPDRLHLELWFNDPKEMNDGPLCRCSAKARRAGIRHGIYVGEDHLPLCEPLSNNPDRLYHYRITMTPHTNFLTKNPTTIRHGGHEYRFEGFSMFSHLPLPQWPNCKVIRFNYEYTILYIEEDFPKNFTVQGLELFNHYLLMEILELVDLSWKAHDDPDGCPRFHFMPRFTRELEDGGKEILSHAYVLEYLLKENQMLIKEDKLADVLSLDDSEWQYVADEVKGMIVTCPGMKPSSIRVDQLDREQCVPSKEEFPVIVHFGVRPPQLSYAGNPHYQKAWRDYVKYRHLLANKPKVRYADRHRLNQKESRLQEMRMENDLKRDVTVVINSKNFYKTGIMSDIIQHAMLLPVLVCHLRFHQSLAHLEEKLGYKFQDRFLLQLALTHPSYRENFGTNPDHARNSLTNCGLRQPQYGDRRIHYMNTRKRGINTLINIMSRFGSRKETLSRINHNERLEFLGDAVVEFLSSIHLFYMFPDLEEGGLATYRAAIVQNQHLAVLSKKLELDRFMLYAHGSDLCHDLELRHAMANCFEALMGALFLDNGIEVADRVFSKTLFSERELLEVWKNFSPHPLQEQEPDGDRKWISSVPLLQKLHKFEEAIGIEFNHIRLLARALTHRSLGYNNLTLGSNQRLEFLGDTVLQLVASEYLYKFFPEHHEGHLSLLRSSLVNNRTQAVVCADLGMVEFAIYPYSKVELKPKDKADLLEAFLGALYVDKDLGYCRKFCEVCFFPRLQDFIMNQDWNDPKSKLQQCCLTLRSMDGGEPDIPTYKVIECKGPTNTRVYSVAVYFQGNRLAVGSGHSIQQAEMDAAANALKKSKDLFPQLRHQRRAIERSLKQGPPKKCKSASKDPPKVSK